jgi:hypothetical protein
MDVAKVYASVVGFFGDVSAKTLRESSFARANIANQNDSLGHSFRRL